MAQKRVHDGAGHVTRGAPWPMPGSASSAAPGISAAGRPRCGAAPEEPVARLWHAATLLQEHRGDGHIAARVTNGIGGTQAHVLHAVRAE